MNKSRSAFSLMEISVILIAIALLLTIVVTSMDVLNAAKLNNARNLTKTSVAKDTPGMILWLDSTSVKSFDDENIADGDEIENWNDLKISDKDPYVAIQTTSTNRPLYDEDAINDLPGVKFDGTDDCMQITGFSANAYMTLFVVGKFDSSNFFIEHRTTPVTTDGFYFYGKGTAPTAIRRTSTVQNTNVTDWFGSNTAIGIMRHGTNGITYKLNNGNFVTPVATTLPNTILTDTLNIGSRNCTGLFTNGSFGEVIMYDRALSDSEVDDIIGYLKSKWEIE